MSTPRPLTLTLSSAALAVLALIPCGVTGETPAKATSAISTVSASAPARVSGLPVTAFADGGTTPRQLSASAAATTTLGVDGVNVSSDGRTVSSPNRAALAVLSIAKKTHKTAQLLVGNYSDTLGDFDPAAAHALVSSAANITAVTTSLATTVSHQGWNGVNVDLEAIRGVDKAGIVRFIRALKAALPVGRTVSMDVTAYPTAAEYSDNGYDLVALGHALDRVVLMAYDQHGPTWTASGPVGGLPWQKSSLAVLTARVPASKVDLGVAGYGYSWPRSGDGQQYSDAGARALVTQDKAVATWDARQGEWTATLHNGTVLWWSDSKSWAARVALARAQSLHGLALWSLSLSDPITGS